MVLFAIGVVLAIATVIVFIFGMFSMTRGGQHDRQHSGSLMLARVEMQALALALMALAAYLIHL
jgi:Hypoxia induced protein conserved region